MKLPGDAVVPAPKTMDAFAPGAMAIVPVGLEATKAGRFARVSWTELAKPFLAPMVTVMGALTPPCGRETEAAETVIEKSAAAGVATEGTGVG